MANHSSASTPLTTPEPLVDEYVDEAPDVDTDDHSPEEVSDDSGQVAPKIKKRVVRRK